MHSAEIPFPRGGKPRKKSQNEQESYEDLVGKINVGGTKKIRKKKKLQKQSEVTTGDTPDVLVENLTMQNISSGMVLLGCVFEIEDYCVKLSLPGRLFGTVPIVNISDKYMECIRAFSESPDNDDVTALQALFRVGQTVACKVVSTKSSKSHKNHITLTVNPRHVNEVLQPASLLHGMLLYCAVQSVEDHGYVMDTGIKNVPGFLSHSSAAQYIKDCNNGENLTVGHLVPTVIDMPSLKKGRLRSGQAVTLTADPTLMKSCKLSQVSDIALDTFTPGTVVDAVVQKMNEHGLVVDCLGFSGCVYKDHLKNITGKHSAYNEGQSIQGIVLYANPITHVLHLTMLPKPSLKKFNKMFGGLKKWQVIDNAVVTAVHNSNVCVKLRDNVQGIAMKNELSDQPLENVSKKFSVGDSVRCRVIYLHYLDNMVSISLKESILGQTYVSRNELTVGEIYEGKVKKLVPGGMVVVLSPGVQGFVRDIHMADVPLTKPEVMFPKGKKVRCKVLTVDHLSNTPALLLTCKKGLLMTKVPILSSYKEATPGVTTKGVIVNIKDNGLVLTFLNEVQGWVPSSELGAYKIQNPEKVFFKGQVVKCRVMSCYPKDRKLFLTLKIDNSKLFGDKDMSLNKFEVGKIVEVRVKKKTEKGLDVVVKGTKFQAFLPMLHLSDHIENCQSLLECYREKDIVHALCFSSKGVPVVTMKSTLMEAAKNGVPCSQISDYKEQSIVPVVVKHFAKYGMFVELGYNITGLVPNKYIADRKISQPEEAGFIPYQTLLGKIHKVEYERNRLELSTKMEDIYKNEYTYGLDLLQSYFDDISKIREYYLSLGENNVKAKLVQLSTGSVVTAKVTCITENGALCILPDGVKGFVATFHCGTTRVEEGHELRAVVLFVDMTNECVELSCRGNILRNVSNLRDVESSKVKVDQVIKGECVVVKKEYVILALGGHAVGRFGFVPARRALNDLIGRGDLFTVGQHYHVVMKRIIFDDIAVGVLKQHVKDLNNDNEGTLPKRKREEKDMPAKRQKVSTENCEDTIISQSDSEAKSDEYQNGIACVNVDVDNEVSETADVGEMYELAVGKKYVATIKKIKEFQMDILIKNRIPGRVHITEAAKDPSEGMKPFEKFIPGSEVSVWVIGFHSKRTYNFLALSHCKMKIYAECSLFKDPPVQLNRNFRNGDKVKGFVKEVDSAEIGVWLAPDVKGTLPLYRMNVDFSALLKPRKYFHKGDVIEAHIFDVLGKQIHLTQYPNWEPKPGMNVCGLVQVVSADRGLSVKLPHGYLGEVHLTDMKDSYVQADCMLLPLLHKRIVHCNILDVNEEKFCQLSTRPSRLRPSGNNPRDPELTLKDVKHGITARGFVKAFTNSAITVALGRNLDGTVSLSNMTAEERKNLNCLIGDIITVEIVSKKQGQIVCIISETGKRSIADDKSSASAKNKKASVEKDVNEDFQGDAQQLESRNNPTGSHPGLQVANGFNFGLQSISGLKRPTENLSGMSDGDEVEAPLKRHKKDSDKLDKENYVFNMENTLLSENRTAQTAEEYEEALKQSPNSAGHWLNYIGFFLEQMNVDKARNVAERALKTISFREEQEKLKIWIIFLNLENLYGTEESMQRVFERAVQQNEALKIYSVVVRVYQSSNKLEEAENLYQIMVKKFHLNKDVWIDFGLFYMKTGRPELARKVMDRSLKSLDQKQHVDVISKFAQMEFKHGDASLGKTMFENILKNYPKRTDLWSIYIDLLIKLGELDAVRKLFEQVITTKVSPRKMKFFFKRYLSFERDHGTEETANEVVRKASEYFKSDFLCSV